MLRWTTGQVIRMRAEQTTSPSRWRSPTRRTPRSSPRSSRRTSSGSAARRAARRLGHVSEPRPAAYLVRVGPQRPGRRPHPGAWSENEQLISPLAGLVVHEIEGTRPPRRRRRQGGQPVSFDILGWSPWRSRDGGDHDASRPHHRAGRSGGDLRAADGPARPRLAAGDHRHRRGRGRCAAAAPVRPAGVADDLAVAGWLHRLARRTPAPRQRTRPGGRLARHRAGARRTRGGQHAGPVRRPGRHRQRHRGARVTRGVAVPERRPLHPPAPPAGGGPGRARHHGGLRPRRPGLTSTVLHYGSGPVGRAAQMLTVRRR